MPAKNYICLEPSHDNYYGFGNFHIRFSNWVGTMPTEEGQKALEATPMFKKGVIQEVKKGTEIPNAPKMETQEVVSTIKKRKKPAVKPTNDGE